MNGSCKAAILGSLMMVVVLPACGTDTSAPATATSQTPTSGEPTVSVTTPTVQEDTLVPESPETGPAPARAGTLAYLVDGDIYVADQDGSNAVKIAAGTWDCEGTQTGVSYFTPQWSPDGRYLASRFWDCADSDSHGGAIFDAEGNMVARFPLDGWGIAWSPDSTRVAVWDVRFGTVGVYGLDGTRQARLTVPPKWSASGDFDPKWTQDGSSVRVGKSALPLDGSTPGRLPSFWRNDACATLSPDGSLVAYRGRGSVTVARSDGSDAREVFDDTSAGHDRCHAWSPTGDRIAFATHEGELRAVDVTTGSATLLIEREHGVDLGVIGFSPGGDRIFFSKAGAGLWSVGLDGTDARFVVDAGAGTIVEVLG